jgi:hypothetical protein
MTVQGLVDNRCDRRVMSELMLRILGHNAMGLQRGPKVIRRYLLFRPALKVDETGEISMEGSVLEHPPDDANQRKSFGSTGLVFVVHRLAVEGGQEGAERIHEREARREHHLGRKLDLP